MSVFIGHSSGSKPSVAAAAAADILEAELALGGTPGATQYYGTNASSVRGFYPLPAPGGPGGSTNLGITQDASTVTLSSSSGTGVVIPAATITLAGAMTAADRIKLNGISTGATANAADSALRDRATHTGAQAIGTVTGLSGALAGKADLSAASFGNLSCSDYLSIVDNASSFTMTLEFASALTNDQTIWLPNASGTLALVGHTHTADNLTDATALGKAAMQLPTPPATRFAAFNSGGTITLLDEPNFRSAIGACAGDDARLSDARTPTAHTHPASAISDSTTLGRALMTATNPSAIAFVRVNADNTVTLLDAAGFRTAIGAGTGSPGGSGTELQFRSAGAFAAVSGSSVSGSSVTLSGNFTAGGGITGASFEIISTITIGNPTWGNRMGSGFVWGWSSTSTPYAAPDLLFRRRAAANWAFGAADASSAVAQTTSVQSVVAGTSNTAGALWSLDGSQGTGTGNGGAIRIRTAPAGSTGTAQNGYVDSLLVRPGRGLAISNGNFSAASDCIGEITVLRGSTSGTTPAILSESALGGGLPIPLNTVMQALVLVQGMSESGDVARYARHVCVKNFAGTSSLHSSATVVSDESGTTALSITVSDGTDTLNIEVTGTSGNNWRWSAVIFGGELVRNVPA